MRMSELRMSAAPSRLRSSEKKQAASNITVRSNSNEREVVWGKVNHRDSYIYVYESKLYLILLEANNENLKICVH